MEVSYTAYILALAAVIAIVVAPLTITGSNFVVPGRSYVWTTSSGGANALQGIYFSVVPKYNTTLVNLDFSASTPNPNPDSATLYLFDENTFPDATEAGTAGSYTDLGCSSEVTGNRIFMTGCSQFLLEGVTYNFYARVDSPNLFLADQAGNLNDLWRENNALEVFTSFSSSADFTVVESPLYGVSTTFNYTRVD